MNGIRLALTLTIALLLGYTASAQDVEWKKYEYIGSAHQMAFLINVKEATAVKNRVLFKGRMADAITTVSTKGESFLGPDYESYVQTEFEANCDTNEYTFIRATGLFRGQVVNIKYEPNNQVADKKTIIGMAIEKVCKEKVGLRA
jgi:hypothetical protein